MATVWSDVNGNILAMVRTFTELVDDFPGGAPAGTATTLDFDETQNVTLLTDLFANQNQYTLTGGGTPVLKKNGTVQAVTALSGASTAWLNAVTQAGSVTPSQIQQVISLLFSGTATAAQEQKILAFLIIKLSRQGII